MESNKYSVFFLHIYSIYFILFTANSLHFILFYIHILCIIYLIFLSIVYQCLSLFRYYKDTGAVDSKKAPDTGNISSCIRRFCLFLSSALPLSALALLHFPFFRFRLLGYDTAVPSAAFEKFTVRTSF